MKCSLALTTSALLLLLGSASTLPLVDLENNVVIEDDGLDFILLDVDPRVRLVSIEYEVEGDSSLELEEQLEEGAGRRKRQTTVTGGVNREDLGHGAHRDTGNIGISHKAGSHTVSSGVSVDKTRIPGVGSNKQVGVNVGYEYKPNKNTRVHIGASQIRGNGGRRNNFGAGFRHTFGRK